MLDWIIPSAMAAGEGTAASPVASQNPIMSFVPFIVIFFIFYFLMIRPQKKRLEQEQSFLSSIKKGDEIYTKSGIIGTIVGLTDSVATLEVSAGVKMKCLRSQVAGLTSKLFEKKEDKSKK